MVDLKELIEQKRDEVYELEAGSEEAKTGADTILKLAQAKKELADAQNREIELTLANETFKHEKKKSRWELGIKIVGSILVPIICSVVAIISRKKAQLLAMAYEAGGTLRGLTSKKAVDEYDKAVDKFEKLRLGE